MKRLILLCIICSLCLSLAAQKFNIFRGDTINRVDQKGLKQGIWRKYYSNDVLFSEGVFNNGKHVGTFKTYYKSGKPQSILKFRGTSEICSAEIFSEDSGLMAKGKYIEQQKDSTWIYFDRMEKKSSDELYVKGKKEGLWKLYYPNGQVSRIITYTSDKKNGPYKEFFMDGVVKVDAIMKNDEFDGLLTINHPSGKVWQRGVYMNGLKEGKWVNFLEVGTVEREDYYKRGIWLNPVSDEKEIIPEKN